MGIEILHIEKVVDDNLPYRDEPGFRESIRNHAAHALGDKILRDAALYQKIPPKRDEPPYTRHRWSVGIERDVPEIEMRATQLEQAEKRGRMRAAGIVRKMAERYDVLSGGCAGVIAHSLREAAEKIDEA